MKTEEKWKRKARKFLDRAKYSEGEISKRTDKVKADEERAIYRAFSDLERNTKMVAWIFNRDRRTVTSALAKTESYNVIKEYTLLKEGQLESEQLRTLTEFLLHWKAELPLPLNYLGNEDLSIGRVPAPSGGIIIWEYSPGAPVIRRLEIEDETEFELMRKNMAHSKLWKHFRGYKLLCGRVIEACSTLIRDIRTQAEKETGLNTADTGELGLDRYFAWTVYADALNIFDGDWSASVYYCTGKRDDIYHLCWGDYTLAVIAQRDKITVETAHKDLGAEYRESPEVRRVLELSAELHTEEQVIRAELDAILEALAKRL